jgi:hypothetical protein
MIIIICSLLLFYVDSPPSKKRWAHGDREGVRGLNKSSEILKAKLRQYRGNIRASYISI